MTPVNPPMNYPLIPIELGAETVAVVPARALSWHRVQLPAGTLKRGPFAERSSPRLRAVLEGLLEDQLLDEPAQLHFALQPQAQDDTPVWVAVCHKQWLQDALNALQQTGQTPQRLVPEWVPEDNANPPRWVTGDADSAQLVWADAQGVHVWPLSDHRAEVDASQSTLQQRVPADAELWAEPAVAQMAERIFHRSATVLPPTQRLRDAAQTDWDLAQFDFARRSPWLARLSVALDAVWHAPQWRPARWATIGLVGVQVLGLNAFAWHARNQLQQQRSAIVATLTSTFPEVTVVVDAPLQMERALGALRQTSGGVSGKDMESMLSVLGASGVATLVPSAPTAIDFVAGEMRMTGGNYSPESSAALNTALQPYGLTSLHEGDALVLRTRNTAP